MVTTSRLKTGKNQPTSVVEEFHDLKADFRAGEDSRFQSRLKGTHPGGSGADYHLRDERKHLHLMERARMYRREDCVVGQGVNRVVANVVQDGFTLEPQTKDAGFNAEVKEAWKEWAEDEDLCDVEGERTFHEYEKLVLDTTITDGAVLILPLNEGCLQPMEVHRLRTPRNTKKNVYHGIELDERRKRIAYWVTRDDIGFNQSIQKVSDVNQIAARDEQGWKQAFYVYGANRFSATLGYTAFAPISYMIGAHDDTQFAALLKQQMGALIAILRERGADWKPLANQLGQIKEEDMGGYIRTILGMSAGLEIASDPGEKIQMFSSNVPGPQFKEHTLLILTFIAINLDLPLAVLLLDPSMTNFSGWRGAIEQARLRWRQLQKLLIGKFHRPTYWWWLRRQFQTNPAFRGWETKFGTEREAYKHNWNAPTWPYLEPLTDASADLLQDRNALNSKRRIHAARGRQWTEVLAEILEDNSMGIVGACKAARLINDEFPEAKVTWRDVLTLATPDGVQIGITTAPGESARAEPKQKPAEPAKEAA